MQLTTEPQKEKADRTDQRSRKQKNPQVYLATSVLLL